MGNRSKELLIGKGFLILCATIWLIAGIAYLLRYAFRDSFPTWMAIILGAGMLAGGIGLLVLAIRLGQPRRTEYRLALVILGGAVVAILFDQVGWADIAAAIIALAGFVYFLIFRKQLGG